jgi:hypothetical protein
VKFSEGNYNPITLSSEIKISHSSFSNYTQTIIQDAERDINIEFSNFFNFSGNGSPLGNPNGSSKKFSVNFCSFRLFRSSGTGGVFIGVNINPLTISNSYFNHSGLRWIIIGNVLGKYVVDYYTHHLPPDEKPESKK